jgi:poly(hydroxyalkanoate) depolymerase family esterase
VRYALAALVVSAGTLIGAGAASAAPAAGADIQGVYANASGFLTYDVHLPPSFNPATPMPVLVAVHGCLMTGDGLNSMRDMTRFSDLADARGFIVVYPTQNILRNAEECWNFADPTDQVRGSGEPSLLAGIAQAVVGTYHADAKRVSLIGVSSGAAMASIMGATYPDVFAAVGIFAGCEYACDQAVSKGLSPVDTAKLAYAQMGTRARQVPTLIAQGDADTTVPPMYADRLVTHWAAIDDLANDGKLDGDVDNVPETRQRVALPGAHPYVETVYTDSTTKQPLIEKYVVEGLTHEWPGGGTGLFVDPVGPDMTTLIWNFFSAQSIG